MQVDINCSSTICRFTQEICSFTQEFHCQMKICINSKCVSNTYASQRYIYNYQQQSAFGTYKIAKMPVGWLHVAAAAAPEKPEKM